MSELTNEEIEAAAERLIANGWDYANCPDQWGECNDARVLAKAYLARLAADRAEREERERPIDAEWCEGECDEVVRCDGRGWTWMLDERAEEDVRLFVWDDFSAGIWWRHPEDAKDDWQPLPMTWNVETRGQLLDLLRILKGGAE